MWGLFFLLFFLYILLFLYSLQYKNNSIVDVFWGIIFVIIALYTFFVFGNFSFSQIVITGLIFLWGIRLSVHIFLKKFPDIHHEDARYARWRSQWKYFYIRSFFQVFLLQLLLASIVATPIFITNSAHTPDTLFVTILGAVIALFGLAYEIRADRELKKFLTIKKTGEILTSGLRKFHRYPQYFGESIFWLGISIIGFQFSYISLVGYLTIFILLRYVSGVPLLEKRYSDNPAFQDYSKKIPVFFPDLRKIIER